jgi:chromosome partitioning protein
MPQVLGHEWGTRHPASHLSKSLQIPRILGLDPHGAGVSNRNGAKFAAEKGTWMATVVSLINMKGGVGKTTLATQLAHAADQKNLRTLAIDLDPQSNLSQSLMTPAGWVKHIRAKKPTVAQILEGYTPASDGNASPTKVDIHDVIVKAAGFYKGSTLDLIPSRLELSQTLKNPTGKERRLAKALSHVADEYDLVLIDCAPTESILTEAAYFASRYVLVPVKPEFLATVGLPLLARSLNDFKDENGDHSVDICGIAFVHSSSYSRGPEGQTSIKDVNSEAKKNGWPIFSTQVRYSASYAKSAREGTPIGNTSYVQWPVTAEWSRFMNEFLLAVGVSQSKP